MKPGEPLIPYDLTVLDPHRSDRRYPIGQRDDLTDAETLLLEELLEPARDITQGLRLCLGRFGRR